MCTVTLVPLTTGPTNAGVRVVFNRDERRTRDAAAPPGRHRLGGRDAIYPRDPVGGGTWIGVNDAGLVVALLNVYDGVPAQPVSGARSRGVIVGGLLGCATLAAATAAAAAIDAHRFAPFRLVILQDRTVAIAAPANGLIGVTTTDLHEPMLLTSSALGDARVAGPRRRLFDRLVVHGRHGWLEGQARFHRHQWARRPEWSVRMERRDARTVSRTTVDVGPGRRTMWYEAPAAGGGWHGARQWCSLP